MPDVRVLSIYALFAAATSLSGQSTQPLPSLPASPPPAVQSTAGQSNKSIFTLPRNDAALVALPTRDKPDPAADAPQETCFAPAEGFYAPRPVLSPELKELEHRYTSIAVQNLGTMWFRGMPRAAKDPWLKGAKVIVRFAILKDGSIDTPRVTVSSGRESYDRHALDAVYKTIPFAPLPDGIGRVFPMCVTFSYNQDDSQWKKPVDLWPTKPGASPDPQSGHGAASPAAPSTQ